MGGRIVVGGLVVAADPFWMAAAAFRPCRGAGRQAEGAAEGNTIPATAP